MCKVFGVNRCANIWFLFYFGKNLKNSALPKSKFGVLWKKSQSNSFSKSKICQGVVGFIDLRQISHCFWVRL